MADHLRRLKPAIRLQGVWLSTFLLGVLAGIAFQVLGEGRQLESTFRPLWKYTYQLYLPGAALLALLNLCRPSLARVPLWFFYLVWIKRVFPSLRSGAARARHERKRDFCRWMLKKFFDEQLDALIFESFPPQVEPTPQNPAPAAPHRPLVIRREHLLRKRFLPDWAFSIVILFNEMVLSRVRTAAGEIKTRLKVDLRGQSCGIYNSAGKLFLMDHVHRDPSARSFLAQGEKIDRFLTTSSPGEELRIQPPFRWASGGGLAVVRWRGEDWYVTFFREVPPVGWNVANGASESRDEYKDLHRLLLREFCEELIVLDREPRVGSRLALGQKVFQLDPLIEERSDLADELKSMDFVRRHNQMRRAQDGIRLEETEGPSLTPVRTPFEIELAYHAKNRRKVLTRRIPDVIFSVNPGEMGVETMGVYRLEIDDDDYLLFGEIWEAAECLIRAPVMLLSCEFVRQCYERRGTLGEIIWEEPFIGGKRLDRIPRDSFWIFYRDIDFREHRLKTLENLRPIGEKYRRELAFHRAWLANYRECFRALEGQRGDISAAEHDAAAVLCPVTWRTLESIARERLIV